MEVKEVKEITTHKKRSKNFYFTVFSLIKQGVTPSKICDLHSISKQKLNYYLSSLKRSGFINKIGYGVWEITKEFDAREVKKTTRVGKTQLAQEVKTNSVRGHAFQFVLKLPKGMVNWKHRKLYFDKIKLKYTPLVLGGIDRGQRIIFKGRKVWLTNGSIIIYEKSSYMADTAQLSKDYAISKLITLVKALEKYLRADFSFSGKYKFKVSRQHYALVKNALAKQYNENNEKLQVYNNTGLWFLIDNSFNLNEAETVHSKTAVNDNTTVQNFFNSLKETKGYTPEFVTTSLANQTENLDNYALHLKSHVKSVQDLGKGVAELVEVIKELKKETGK